MYHYVNHQAMREVFAPVEVETDPAVRAEVMQKIYDEFADNYLEILEKTCWELKHKRGWNTGQIADTLNISERKAKMFIRWYAERTGEWNPLSRPHPGEVIDISDLVKRNRQDSTPSTQSASEPAQVLDHPTAG